MLHIIQNDPEVPPGNLLADLMVPFRLHHPYQGDPLPAVEEISALIVLGGAMGANDDLNHPFLTRLKLLLREVVSSGTPYLGICLGGQLLAAALGAQVVSNRWEELGVMEVALTPEGRFDPLFEGVADVFTTFQWHHDSFNNPPGSVLLASSTACRHQAFRFAKAAWGLQFHPEVTEAIIRDWCAWGRESAAVIEERISSFNVMENDYRTTSRRLRDNFLRIAGCAVPPQEGFRCHRP